MQFVFKNLGIIKDANIDLAKLTILCGKNNSGKTYLSHAIYGVLKSWEQLANFEINKEHAKDLSNLGFCKIDLEIYRSKIDTVLEKLSQNYINQLHTLFNTDSDYFKDTTFQIKIDNLTFNLNSEYKKSLFSKKKEIIHLSKDANSSILEISILSENRDEIPPIFALENIINSAIASIFLGDKFKRPFIFTAERSGIALFYKELDINKSFIIDEFTKISGTISDIDPFLMIKDLFSRYTKPIKDNIDFIRDINEIVRYKSDLDSETVKGLDNILDGSFKMVDKELIFIAKDGRKKVKMPLHLTSSSAKSLIGLSFYVKHIAKKNDILIIDEPELNLHPDNQRKLARLFATLVNSGINIFITTHSDYIIKEFSNLIMLSNSFDKRAKIMYKYDYNENEVLDIDSVKLYVSGCDNRLKELKIDKKLGIEIDSFDAVINDLNSSTDEIYYSLMD